LGFEEGVSDGLGVEVDAVEHPRGLGCRVAGGSDDGCGLASPNRIVDDGRELGLLVGFEVDHHGLEEPAVGGRKIVFTVLRDRFDKPALSEIVTRLFRVRNAQT